MTDQLHTNTEFSACIDVQAEHNSASSEPDNSIEHARPRSVTQSVSSGVSVIQNFELAFQLEKDSLRFQMFTICACLFAYSYSIGACCMFFSSLYPVPANVTHVVPHASAIDAVIMTSHVFAIDATSAIFVMTGFFSAYIFANVPLCDRVDLCKIFALYVLIDVWLVGWWTVVAGSIFHLLRGSFRAQDVALSVVESILSLRAFEIEQGQTWWHTMNPSAWPILCFFWATIFTPVTIAANERLRQCQAGAEVVVPWINASAPILVISLFALVHDNSNIFYFNASHVGYRILEYNLGICIYSSMISCPANFWRVANIMSSITPFVLAGFVILWWAELGQPVEWVAGNCIRMYNFSPCIHRHHGFLMRGCFLGSTLVCRIVASSEDCMRKVAACVYPSNRHALMAVLIGVLITWPCCYVVHILLEIHFGVQLVRDNAALLAVFVPHIAFALALHWDVSLKPRIFLLAESSLNSFFGQQAA